MSDRIRETSTRRVSAVKWFAISAVTVAGAWGLAWFLMVRYVDAADRGVFGDMFGSVNSLFSGLAFAGLIVAIVLQREELRLQRDELSETREQLGRAAEAQEQSRQALADQARVQAVTAKLSALSALLHSENLAPQHQRSTVKINLLEVRIEGALQEISRLESGLAKRSA